MSRKIHILMTWLIISAMIPLTAFTISSNLSAQEKKSEIVSASVPDDSKIKSSEFSPAASGSQAKQDEPVLVNVTLVILVIWTGISFFLIHLERKIKKIETGLKD